MIVGALAWQAQGLCPPGAVTSATRLYLEAEDALSAWIDECCKHDPNAWTTISVLFASWRAWADQAGEQQGTRKRFIQNLETRGFSYERKKYGRGIAGIRIG